MLGSSRTHGSQRDDRWSYNEARAELKSSEIARTVEYHDLSRFKFATDLALGKVRQSAFLQATFRAGARAREAWPP